MTPLIKILAITITAFVTSLLCFPVLIKLLTKWKVFDSISEHKIHTQFTPSLGGIAIFVGVVLSFLIGLPMLEWIKFKYFFIAVGLMFLVGLRDDILTLRPHEKLIGQFLPILVLLLYDQLLIDSTQQLLGLERIPAWLFTSMVIVGFILITNAYNLIDGLDGLAGSIGIVCMTFYGIWFFQVGEYSLSLIALGFGGSLAAFLIFNWEPSKIFMGDTGALVIGFIIAYMTMLFINDNLLLPMGNPVKFNGSITAAVCILIIPVFDTTRVIILRLRKGLSPLKGDKNHLHHQFLRIGFNHAQSVGFLAAINVFFIGFAWILRTQPDFLLVPIIVVACLLINFVLKWAQHNEGTNRHTG